MGLPDYNIQHLFYHCCIATQLKCGFDLHLKIYKIGNKSIYRMLLLLPDTLYNRNVNHMRVVRMDNAGGDVFGPILT